MEGGGNELLRARFWLVVVSGGTLATFGILANAMLTRLFLSRLAFRHSPFFFLGFVALFDTLLDATYILLLVTPVFAEYFELAPLYLLWLRNVQWLYLVGQIFKLSSVFCLIVASFERYMVTSHWTFTGFEERTRWLVLTLVLSLAVAIRFATTVDVVVLMDRQNVDPFRRYSAGQIARRDWLPNFLNLFTVIVPFGTLVFFNGGIVLMLRQQSVQQLRSLITELTMGHDFMKVRRRNIRAATNTLLLIISVYLISNLLSLFLSIASFLNPGSLQRNYPLHYRMCSDCASLLTVIGNALRFPAHFCSNAEVREQCEAIFYPPREKKSFSLLAGNGLSPNSSVLVPVESLKLRRHSERLDNPWFSALLTTRQSFSANRLPTNRISRASFVGHHARLRRDRRAATMQSELRAYLGGSESQRQQQISRKAAEVGCCAVCQAQQMDGSCCSGGALGTEREALYEEMFAEENEDDEEDDIDGGDEEQQLFMVLTDKDGMEEERPRQPNCKRRDERSSSNSQTIQKPMTATMTAVDLVTQLRFDPHEFAALSQAI